MQEEMTEKQWQKVKKRVEKSAKKLKCSPYEAALHTIRVSLLYLWRYEAHVFSVEKISDPFGQLGKLAEELKVKNVWNQKEIDIVDAENQKLKERIRELEAKLQV